MSAANDRRAMRPEDARMLRQIRRALANLCSTP